MKDRESNPVNTAVVDSIDQNTVQRFVTNNTTEDARVYTDESRSYLGLPRKHHTVKHSVGEYVNGHAHTNGIESFRAMLKRGHKGVYHKMIEKHLHRYIDEFRGRHNQRKGCPSFSGGDDVQGF